MSGVRVVQPDAQPGTRTPSVESVTQPSGDERQVISVGDTVLPPDAATETTLLALKATTEALKAVQDSITTLTETLASKTDAIMRTQLPTRLRSNSDWQDNFIPNPSFSRGTKGWSTTNCTLTQDSYAYLTKQSGKFVAVANGAVEIRTDRLPVTLTASDTYSGSAYVRGTPAAGRACSSGTRWYNAQGDLLSTTTYATTISSAGSIAVAQLLSNVAPPLGATEMECFISISNAVAGEAFWNTGCWMGSNQSVSSFLDGDSYDSSGAYYYFWTGEPGNSPSVKVARKPLATDAAVAALGSNVDNLARRVSAGPLFPETKTAENLIPAENYSIGGGASNCTATLVGGTYTGVNANAYKGKAAVRLVPTAAGNAYAYSTTSYTSTSRLSLPRYATAGDTLTFGFMAKAGTNAGRTLIAKIEFGTSFGSIVGATTFTNVGTTVTGTAQPYSVSAVIPDQAEFAIVYYGVTAQGTGGNAELVHFDSFFLGTLPAGDTFDATYAFDGDSPGCYWTGTPLVSSSRKVFSTPLPAGTNALGTVGVTSVPPVQLDPTKTHYATDATLRDIAAGNGWVVGARLALGSSQIGHMALTNPAGSGKIITILGHTVYCDQNSMRVRYLNDGTYSGGSLATPTNLNQGYDGLVTSSMQGRFGVAIASGGTYLSTEGRTAIAAPLTFEVPLILPPGQSFGIEITAPAGLAASADVAATCVYIEVLL